MADITAVGEENPSPTQDELQQAAAGNGAPDNRTPKRRMSDDEEDEEKQGRVATSPSPSGRRVS